MPTAQLHCGTVVTLCTFRDALDGIGSGLKSIGAGVAAGVAGLVLPLRRPMLTGIPTVRTGMYACLHVCCEHPCSVHSARLLVTYTLARHARHTLSPRAALE